MSLNWIYWWSVRWVKIWSSRTGLLTVLWPWWTFQALDLCTCVPSACKVSAYPSAAWLTFTPCLGLTVLAMSSEKTSVGVLVAVYFFQFSSVTQSCPTLCNPMNRSTPALPVHHHLPEFTQTHVLWVSDAIQPSHPLSSPSPPAPSIKVFSNESTLRMR